MGRFKFFLFARFSHNQPLLFLLIPHTPTITFKTMFHCPQHLVKFLRNSISTHTHKIGVDFKMSRKMLKCQKVGSRKHFEIIPQKKLHIQFTVKACTKAKCKGAREMRLTSLHPPGEDTPLTTLLQNSE